MTNNWGDDAKVDISDTGISVTEAYRLLRQLLGHDIHISGEIYHATSGITFTVRASGQPAGSFSGRETDLDGLMQKAAEDIYGATQPYRYAGYLRTALRPDEARPIYEKLTQQGSMLERSWAWIGLATVDVATEGFSTALKECIRSVAITPNYTFGYYYIANTYWMLGQNEAVLAARAKADPLLNRGSVTDINSDYVPAMRLWNGYQIAFLLGDYEPAARLGSQTADLSALDIRGRAFAATRRQLWPWRMIHAAQNRR